MAKWMRAVLSFAAGFGVLLVVTAIRGASGANPVASNSMAGPGFLGAIAMFFTWWLTAPKD